MTETIPASVWAIVLGWNHAEDTIECLRSLSASEGVRLNLLYVDNGSAGDQLEQVLEAVPDVGVVRHPRNMGVSGGLNGGLAYALQHGATHLFMANNDTIMDPSCVRTLLDAAAAEPRAGILVPAIYHYREKEIIWSAGSRYRRFPPVIVMRKGKGPGVPAYSRRESLEFTTFCTALFRAEAWKAAGLLDPSFVFYCDDYDVCLRVRAAGFTLEYVPEARTWHKVERITRAGTASPVFWSTYGRSEAILRRRHPGCRWMLGPAHRLYLLLRALWEGGARACVHFARGYCEGGRVELKPVPQWADRVEPLEVLRALPHAGQTAGD